MVVVCRPAALDPDTHLRVPLAHIDAGAALTHHLHRDHPSPCRLGGPRRARPACLGERRDGQGFDSRARSHTPWHLRTTPRVVSASPRRRPGQLSSRHRPRRFHAAADAAAPWAFRALRNRTNQLRGIQGPGGHYLLRDGAVVAWRVPADAGPATASRMVGAHTDSPGFKLKPRPDVGGTAGGSWGSRSTAVRCSTPGWTVSSGWPAGWCWATAGGLSAPARSCASRSWPSTWIAPSNEGLALDKQQHTAPVWGSGDPATASITWPTCSGTSGSLGGVDAGVGGYDVLSRTPRRRPCSARRASSSPPAGWTT